jgi:tetratricopeptide (TPR) repeat protein
MRHVATFVLALLFPMLAIAQTKAQDEDADVCLGSGAADVRAAACTRTITSGLFSGKALGALYYIRGNRWLDMVEYDRAIADYTQAIQLGSPQDADAFNNRGVALLKKGEKGRAADDFKEAARLDPIKYKPK